MKRPTLSGQFIVIKENGLERLALPNEKRSVIQGSISVHKEGATVKSQMVHKMLLLNSWAGTLTLMPGTHSGYPERLGGFDLGGWLENVAKNLEYNLLYASISFPPKTLENRFVALLVNEAGQSVGFAKVSRDNFKDDQIAVEIVGLEKMADLKPTSFSIPTVLDSGFYDNHHYLILKPIPFSTKRGGKSAGLDLERILHELASLSTMRPPFKCSWWHKVENHINSIEILVKQVEFAKENPIQTSISHGDFGPGNMVQSNGKNYLFDWEEYCNDAPRFTDWFFYLLPPTQLPRNVEKIERMYDTAYEYLINIYPEVTHWDMGLALLFLTTKRNWVASPEATRTLAELIMKRYQK